MTLIDKAYQFQSQHRESSAQVSHYESPKKWLNYLGILEWCRVDGSIKDQTIHVVSASISGRHVFFGESTTYRISNASA